MTIECEHGQLARSCEICDLQRENESLCRQLDRASAEIHRLRGRLSHYETPDPNPLNEILGPFGSPRNGPK